MPVFPGDPPVPRFRIIRSDASDRHGDQHDRADDFDGSDDFDDLHDHFDDQRTRRRRRPAPVSAPRLVLEGKSGRTLVDSDVADDAETDPASGGPDDSGGWPDAAPCTAGAIICRTGVVAT